MLTTDYQDFTTKATPKEERRKIHTGDIWANRAKCLNCGDIIRSKNRHDFRTCSCGNLSVDGGSWYIKRNYKEENSFLNMIEYFNDVEMEGESP